MLLLVNFKIDDDTLNKFSNTCSKQGISKSRAIRFLIREWMKAPKPKKIPKVD